MSGNSDHVALANTKKATPRIRTICSARVCVTKRIPTRIALTWQFKLGDHSPLDFTPTGDMPLPVLAETPEPDVPVLVTIRYRVRLDRREPFVRAMQAVREMRRRNGAYYWQLVHDSEDPTLFLECFMDESWLEHLRQHERMSVSDRNILNRAKAFLVMGTTTKSSHWLGDREQ